MANESANHEASFPHLFAHGVVLSRLPLLRQIGQDTVLEPALMRDQLQVLGPELDV
jgi:hypothetical protein